MTLPKRIAVFALGAVVLVGCQGPNGKKQPNAKPRAVATEVCIMSGRPVDADSPSTVFMGKTVKFCCTNCQSDWERMSEAAKSTKLSTRR